MKTNKNSSTEDQLGVLHSSITRAFQRKIDVMLEVADDPEKADEILFAIDEKTLSAAANWVIKNDITCAQPEVDEQSQLKKSLDAIKAKQSGKVINFTDAKEAM